jgi:hypothetical protein
MPTAIADMLFSGADDSFDVQEEAVGQTSSRSKQRPASQVGSLLFCSTQASSKPAAYTKHFMPMFPTSTSIPPGNQPC